MPFTVYAVLRWAARWVRLVCLRCYAKRLTRVSICLIIRWFCLLLFDIVTSLWCSRCYVYFILSAPLTHGVIDYLYADCFWLWCFTRMPFRDFAYVCAFRCAFVWCVCSAPPLRRHAAVARIRFAYATDAYALFVHATCSRHAFFCLIFIIIFPASSFDACRFYAMPLLLIEPIFFRLSMPIT